MNICKINNYTCRFKHFYSIICYFVNKAFTFTYTTLIIFINGILINNCFCDSKMLEVIMKSSDQIWHKQSKFQILTINSQKSINKFHKYKDIQSNKTGK